MGTLISLAQPKVQNVGFCWLRETADVPDPLNSSYEQWVSPLPVTPCYYYPFKFSLPTYYEIETRLLPSKKLIATRDKPRKISTINGKPGIIWVKKFDLQGKTYVTYCFRVNGAKTELCLQAPYSQIGFPPQPK
jgi:hypothetical protein